MTASDPRVGEIQARLDKVTKPGEWEARQDYIDGSVPDNSMTIVTRDSRIYIGTIALHYDGNNAEFIAAAPADVAYLLAELRDRDEKLARVEALCDAAPRFTVHGGGSSSGIVSTDAIRAAVAAANGGGES